MTTVARVFASVKLVPESESREAREYWEEHRDAFDGPAWLLENILDPKCEAGKTRAAVFRKPGSGEVLPRSSCEQGSEGERGGA